MLVNGRAKLAEEMLVYASNMDIDMIVIKKTVTSRKYKDHILSPNT